MQHRSLLDPTSTIANSSTQSTHTDFVALPTRPAFQQQAGLCNFQPTTPAILANATLGSAKSILKFHKALIFGSNLSFGSRLSQPNSTTRDASGNLLCAAALNVAAQSRRLRHAPLKAIESQPFTCPHRRASLMAVATLERQSHIPFVLLATTSSCHR